MAAALLVSLFLGVMLLGGEFSITRFIDTVNTDDPTTGRAHFWSVTLNMIKAYPYLGTGLGAYGVSYTQYDSRNGLFRLEQAHNDYLQVLSDGGIVGGAAGAGFCGAAVLEGDRACEIERRFSSRSGARVFERMFCGARAQLLRLHSAHDVERAVVPRARGARNAQRAR